MTVLLAEPQEDPVPATTPEPGTPHRRPEEGHRHGRLSARLAAPVGEPWEPGLHPLDGAGLGLAYVPSPAGDAPLRLVVVLHGAGGSARQGLDLLLPVADDHRLLLAAPKAAASTWDVILGGYGPDVSRIDRLLEQVTAAHAVDGVALAGFSDGASYALSLGITNGDLVDAVIAFSPGFTAALVAHGRPRVFVSHGRGDAVLPVGRCSRRIVPRLDADGHAVTYEEFDGGHVVPPAVVARAATWLTEGASR